MSKIKASDLVEIDEDFIQKVADQLKKKREQSEIENPYYTTNEVAKILKKTRLTIVRYINSYLDPSRYPNTQRLKAVKGGKSWLIKKSDLEAYLENPENPEYDEK
jgi:hypothetical protein